MKRIAKTLLEVAAELNRRTATGAKYTSEMVLDYLKKEKRWLNYRTELAKHFHMDFPVRRLSEFLDLLRPLWKAGDVQQAHSEERGTTFYAAKGVKFAPGWNGLPEDAEIVKYTKGGDGVLRKRLLSKGASKYDEFMRNPKKFGKKYWSTIENLLVDADSATQAAEDIADEFGIYDGDDVPDELFDAVSDWMELL